MEDLIFRLDLFSSGSLVAGGSENITTGSDDDTIQIASAEGISIDAGAGSDIISINSGSATISGGEGDDSIYLGSDASIQINYSDGDGDDYVEGFGSNTTISAGSDAIGSVSGEDYLITVGSGTITLADAGSNVTQGSDGNFVYFEEEEETGSSVTSGSEDITTGSMDDTIQIDSAEGISIDAGAGSDIISINSGSATVTTGEGDDSIYLGSDASIQINYSDGDGDDYVEGFGSNTTISAGSDAIGSVSDDGDYVITVGSGTITLANAGSNVTQDADGNFVYYTNAGSVVTVGTADITTGSLNDTIQLASADGISIDAGAGSDIISINSGSATISGGTGDDQIIIGDDASLQIEYSDGDGNDYIDGFNSYTTLNAAGGSGSVNEDGNYVITVGSGTITIAGSNVTMESDGVFTYHDPNANPELDGSEFGQGSNWTEPAITSSGSYEYGSTNDQIVVSGTVHESVTIHSDGGYDQLALGSMTDVYVDMGAGNDSFEAIQGLSNATINTGSDQDTINVNGTTNVIIDAGDGRDLINTTVANNTTIDGGDGDDSIYALNPLYSSINGNDGNDLISVSGAMATGNTIFGGDGDDSIYINRGSKYTIEGGAGDDYVSFTGLTNLVTLDTGEGNDTVQLTGSPAKFNISLGAGSDSMTIGRDVSSITVTGGDDNDTILSNASSVSVDGGAGDDHISIGVNDTYAVAQINQVTASGGDGNDYIYFQASVASGANSTILGGNGNDTIVTEISQSFVVDAGKDDDVVSIMGGTLASIATGEGNDTLITNNVYNSTLETGDGKDYVSLYGDAGLNRSYELNLNTGDGDDTIIADTHDNQITIDAGTGNDVINVISGNQLTIHGGQNDDTISVTSDSITNAEVYGDSGDDYIYMTAGYYVTLDGGTGNDVIENYAGSVSINGGTGDDSILSTGDAATIDGGRGDDTIIAEGLDISIDAGGGDDVVSLKGSNVIAFGGTGDDEITVVDGQNIWIDAQGDADTINVLGGSDVTVYGGAGDDLITNAVDNALIVGGAPIDGSANFGSSSVTGSDTGSEEEGSASFEDSLTASGNDTLVSDASNVSLFAGEGNDMLSVSGSGNLIDGGVDRDEINIHDISDSTVFAGVGDDTVNATNAQDVTIYGGAGDDVVSLLSGSNILVEAEDGNDSLYNYSAKYSTLRGGNGNNFVDSRVDGAYMYIETGDGDDTVNNLSANTTILTGEGDDSINSRADLGYIDAGNGSNYVELGNASLTVTAGSGNDTIVFNYTYDSTIDAGDGDNSIYAEYQTERNSILTGAGNDTVAMVSMSSDTLETGDGDDLVSIGGNGSNIVILGSGDDTITIINGVDNSIDAGAGDDLIQFTTVSVLGSDGSTLIDTGSYNAGNATLIGGAGDDTIYAHDGGSDIIQYADGDGNDVVYGFNGSEDLINVTSGAIRNHYQVGSDVVLQIGSGNVTLKGVAGEDVSIMGEDGSIYNIFGSDTGSNPDTGSGSNSGSDSGSDGSNSGSAGSHSTYDPDDSVIGSGLGFSVDGAQMGSDFNEDGSRFVYITDSGSVYFATTGDSSYDATISLDSSQSIGAVAVNPDSTDDNNFIFSAGLIGRSWNVTMGAGNDTIQVQNILGGNIDAGSGDDYVDISKALAGNLTLTGGEGSDIFFAEAANVTNASYQHEVTITDLSDEDLIIADAGVSNLTNDFFSGDSFLTYAETAAAMNDSVYARTVIHVGSNSASDGTYSTSRFADSVGGSATRVVWTNSDSTSLDANNIGSDSMLIFTNSNDTISGGIGNDTIFTGDSTNVVYNSSSGGSDLVLNWDSSNVLGLSTIPSSMSINSSGQLEINDSSASMIVSLASGSFTNSTNINFNLNGSSGIARVATGDNNEVIYDDDVSLYDGVSNGTLVISGNIESGSGSTDSVGSVGSVDSITSINLASSGNTTYSHISNIDASATDATLILTGDSSSNIIYAGQTATTLQGGGGNDSLIGGSGADVFVYDSTDGNVTVYSGESDDAVDLSAWTESDVNGHYNFVNGNVVFGFSSNHSLTIIGSNLTTISIAGSDGSIHTIEVDYGSGTIGSLDPYDNGSGNPDNYNDPKNTDIDDSLIGTDSIGTWIDPNNIGFIVNNAPSIVGSINTTRNNYDDIGDDAITTFTPSLASGDSSDGIVSISASNHAGNYTATGDDNYNFTFGGTTQIATWNATLGTGDDRTYIANVKSGTFDGADGHDLFYVTSRLAGDITLVGGAEEDTYPMEAGNLFYAESGTVASSAAQRIVTVADPSFDNGDILLIDAGVENLTADFFGDGQFLNYSNATEASTTGVHASTVFDAETYLDNVEMNFSMMHMANKSTATISSDNTIDESLVTSVVWANSKSTTIDFSDSQDDNILLFTNTNGTNGDLVMLGDDYDDTIYAAANDTIDAGDGNDFISVRSGAYGKNAVINGGAGNDTIVASRATHIVFDDSEGTDIVNNWSSADSGSDIATVLELETGIKNASINSDGQLLVMGENQTMVITSADGSITSDTNIAYEMNGSRGIARVASGSDNVVNYDKSVTFYEGVNEGTLSITSSSEVEVELDGEDVIYDNILNIDATNATGRVELSGNSGNNIIRGGKRSSTLWGGGGNDTLVGGDGRDTFRFTSADGNVTIQNGESNDIVDMTSFTADEIAGWEFTTSGVVIATTSNNSLTIDGTNLTTVSLSGATYTADFTNQTFNT